MWAPHAIVAVVLPCTSGLLPPPPRLFYETVLHGVDVLAWLVVAASCSLGLPTGFLLLTC